MRPGSLGDDASARGAVVVVISGDTPGMTAACLQSLRRYHDGPVQLVDVSVRSEEGLRRGATAAHAAYLRLPAMGQMYAHAVALDLLIESRKHHWVVLLDSDCFVHSGDWWPRLTAPISGAPPAVAAGPSRNAGGDVTLVETWSTLLDLRAIAGTGVSAVPFQSALGGRYADTLDIALTCLQKIGHRVEVVEMEAHALHLRAVTVGAYFLDLFSRNPRAFAALQEFFIPKDHTDFVKSAICRSHGLRQLFGDTPDDDEHLQRFVESMDCADVLSTQLEDIDQRVEPRLREFGAIS